MSMAVRLALMLVLLMAAGGSESAAGGQRPKLVRTDPAELTAAAVAFLASRFDDAREHYRFQRYQNAFRLADAILALAPEVPFRRELKAFRRRAEARYLGVSVVSVLFEREGGESFPISELIGRMTVENLAEQPLNIRSTKGEALALCQYSVIEVGADGSQWSHQGTQIIRSEGAFQLAVAEQRAAEISLPIPRPVGVPVLQVFVVTGSFRPEAMQVGTQAVNRTLPWQKMTFAVVPDELAFVMDNPRKALQRGLDQFESRLVAAAGFLWVRELTERGEMGISEREETIDRLLAALDPDEDGYLDRLVMLLLEALTDDPLRPIKADWLKWGERRGRNR